MLSEGASLTVTPISSGSSSGYDALFSMVDTQTDTIVGAYEVTLTGEMSGALTLAFPVSSEYDGLTLTVLHQKKDGSVERLTGNVAGGKLTIVVTELSPFVITAPNDPQDPDPDPDPIVPPTDTLPKTGDPSMPLLWSALLLLSAVCFVLLRRKAVRS